MPLDPSCFNAATTPAVTGKPTPPSTDLCDIRFITGDSFIVTPQDITISTYPHSPNTGMPEFSLNVPHIPLTLLIREWRKNGSPHE